MSDLFDEVLEEAVARAAAGEHTAAAAPFDVLEGGPLRLSEGDAGGTAERQALGGDGPAARPPAKEVSR